MPVGTAERLTALLSEGAPADARPRLAWNPEFLREGFAVKDTLAPDRLVFGVSDATSEATLREVYAKVLADGTPCVVTDLATAELVKVSANAFLATKISFINAIAEVCEAAGADVTDLADALGHDARIGRKFLNAGIGFGGGCLPKDIRAFQHRAGELGVDHLTSLLREVDAINLHRRERVVRDRRGRCSATSSGRGSPCSARRSSPTATMSATPLPSRSPGSCTSRAPRCRSTTPRATHNAALRFPTLTYVDSTLGGLRAGRLGAAPHRVAGVSRARPRPTSTDVVRRRQIIDGRNLLDAAIWRAAGWTLRSMGRR